MQRQLAQVEAVEIEQVEADQDDLIDLPFSSFCGTAKSVVPFSAGTTTSPSTIADPALMCHVICDLAEALGQSLPRRVNLVSSVRRTAPSAGSERRFIKPMAP
jgi:hypothetical protein